MGAITNNYFTQFSQLHSRHNRYFIGVFHLGENDTMLGPGANETNLFPANIWPASLDCRFTAIPELLHFPFSILLLFCYFIFVRQLA